MKLTQHSLLTKAACPKCDAILNGASSFKDKDPPAKGDLTVCLYCSTVLMFNEDLSLRVVDSDEVAKLSEEDRLYLDLTLSFIKEYQSRYPERVRKVK